MISERILNKVSQDINIPKATVNKIYNAYWKYIRYILQEIPLKRDLSEDQFNNMKSSVNIPAIGKLYCNYNRYKKITEKYNKHKEEE